MVDPFKNLKWNAAGSLLIMMTMIFTLCLKSWGSVDGLHFSLRELDLGDLGGWVETGKFKKMCTKYNISRYPDIKSDCEHIGDFEMGGILVILIQFILFSVFAMSMQCYNILSSLMSSVKLHIEAFEFEVNCI